MFTFLFPSVSDMNAKLKAQYHDYRETLTLPDNGQGWEVDQNEESDEDQCPSIHKLCKHH